MGKYKTLGTSFDRTFRNDLNANFVDIDLDIQATNNQQILIKRTTIDIFPHDIGFWGIGTNTFGVGQLSAAGSIKLDGVFYRHDTVDLIKVKPGSTLVFSCDPAYQIGVHEFDANKLGVKDSGYQTDKLGLSATTQYVRLLCTTKDYSNVSLEDMIANSNAKVEIAFNDLQQTLPVKPTPKNLVSSSVDLWENGAVSSVGAYTTVSNRLRFKQGLFVEPLIGMRKFYYSVQSGYRMAFQAFNNSTVAVLDTGWLTGTGNFLVPETAVKIAPLISRADDGNISVSEVKEAKVLLSSGNISFDYSDTDRMKTIEAVNQIRNENSIMGLSENFRYVGHRGLMSYAPENTLEAFRLSAFLGVWGAECDLGITSDNQLVLMHDYTVDRTTNGTGNVSSLTLAQVQALNVDVGLQGFTNVKVPTFEQYLAVCKETGLYPVIEIKEDGNATGMTDLVLPILEKYNFTKNCIIQSFSVDVLKRIRSKNNYINLAYLTPGSVVITNTHIATAKSIGNCLLFADGTASHTASIVQAAHKEGIPVWCWNVETETLLNTLISIGVDSITTDSLFPIPKYKRIFSATVSTSDTGATWTGGTSKLRNKVTPSLLDATTLQISFDDPLIRFYTIKFDPIIKVRDITGGQLPLTMNSTYDVTTGVVKVKFYQNGALVNVNSLPRSWATLYVEVIF